MYDTYCSSADDVYAVAYVVPPADVSMTYRPAYADGSSDPLVTVADAVMLDTKPPAALRCKTPGVTCRRYTGVLVALLMLLMSSSVAYLCGRAGADVVLFTVTLLT